MLSHEKQIAEYEKAINQLKEQNKSGNVWSNEEIAKLEKKLEVLKNDIYARLTPWDRVGICRHQSRPKSLDYIKNICEEFVELFGDRCFRDDPAIISGLAKIAGRKFLVIGQEKGSDTETRIYRNFGMPHPEGYRKALRMMQLAEKFQVPVVVFLDTPGAYPGLAAEERGQGWAIAKNLMEMAKLKTPIIAILIGEGCSGGALGIGMGDKIGMLEHSYYSVISPEGCSSILWKDASKNSLAASTLKMQSEDLLDLKIIDEIIKEPLGGAHLAPQVAFENVKNFILDQWEFLKFLPLDFLLESRYQKFRQMGSFEVENPIV
ncbi:MAG: acetyl-CoA carboxylase carboxyltransferase subunit alpha [Rhabdochlamydiaceae bacterium]